MLAAGGFHVFAMPLVEFLYEHGRFTAEATLPVAALLAILSLAVPGWVAQQIGVRAFYAREEMWRPMLLGTAIVVLALPLYFTLGQRAGAPGLAWAGVVAISFNSVVTLVWARMRFGAPDLMRVALGVSRSVGVALASALVGGLAAEQVPVGLGAFGELAAGGAAFGVTALILGRLVGEAGINNVVLYRLRRNREPTS
jgi:putative peptidoglycan lipid II flippase